MAEAQKDKNKDDDKDAFERLTGTQKSILMMLIGEEEAAEILKNLSPVRSSTLGLQCIPFRVLVRIWSIRCLTNFLPSSRNKPVLDWAQQLYPQCSDQGTW